MAFGLSRGNDRRDGGKGKGETREEETEVEGDHGQEAKVKGGKAKREVNLLRRNNTEEFAKWQQVSALGHWMVMRGVIPDGVWEGW